MVDLVNVDDIPLEQVPAALAMFAAASQRLAARLLQNAADNKMQGNAPEAGRLLTAAEVAARTGMSVDYMYRNARYRTQYAWDDQCDSVIGLEKWIRSRAGR
jgi:hypothetical protein